MVAFFREVVAAADEVGLKLGNHLWAVDVVHSIWEAAPSPNQRGDLLPGDVADRRGAAHPGRDPGAWSGSSSPTPATRSGPVPALMDHDEVPLESGDVDMARCVRRALMDNQYEGVIIPEHLGPAEHRGRGPVPEGADRLN